MSRRTPVIRRLKEVETDDDQERRNERYLRADRDLVGIVVGELRRQKRRATELPHEAAAQLSTYSAANYINDPGGSDRPRRQAE